MRVGLIIGARSLRRIDNAAQSTGSGDSGSGWISCSAAADRAVGAHTRRMSLSRARVSGSKLRATILAMAVGRTNDRAHHTPNQSATMTINLDTLAQTSHTPLALIDRLRARPIDHVHLFLQI